MRKFRRMVGTDDEEKTWREEFDEQCTLSYTSRMWGFGICFSVGWVLTFLAVLTLPHLDEEPAQFALLYTCGNLLSLCSTVFLWGPCKQLKEMFHKKRWIATAIYLTAMAATIVVAITNGKVLPVLLCIMIQFLAMCWYVLSYIPYGRQMVKNCFGL